MAIASSQATAQQVAVYLPDIAQATLYRHIRAMNEAGILQVVEERPIRGTTERVYAIAVDKVQLSPEEIAALTPEDHERLFSTFTAMLLSQFHNYIQQPGRDLTRDGVRYHTAPLYLSDAEHEDTMRQIGELVKTRMENAASPGRQRRLLSLVVMPDVHSD